MRTEFYGVGFYPAESCTLAFPWVFTINAKARYGNQEGPFEIQLAVSRDLKNWQRPFRVPVIPRGKVGDWECGIQITASRALRVGDEIWLYYCGANYTHGTPVLYRKDSPDRKISRDSKVNRLRRARTPTRPTSRCGAGWGAWRPRILWPDSASGRRGCGVSCER